MSRIAETSTPASRSSKQISKMPRRFFAQLVLVISVLAIGAVTPAAASAVSPWWQVLDGSRPSNLWEPTDSVQKITATMEETEFGEGVVQQMEIEGKIVGCLGSATFLGELGCELFLGLPVITSAGQLATALEPFYGSDVEVIGGPVGESSVVTVPGRSVAPIGFNEEEGQPRFGTVKNEVESLGGSGRLVVTITNLGDEEVDATSNPVTIVDELPAGAVATGYEAFAGPQNSNGPVDCEIETAGTKVTCSFENTLPSYESIQIEILVSLAGEPPAAGAPGTITVSGVVHRAPNRARRSMRVPRKSPSGWSVSLPLPKKRGARKQGWPANTRSS